MAKKIRYIKTRGSEVDLAGKPLSDWIAASGGIATLGEDGKLEESQRPGGLYSGQFAGNIDTGITDPDMTCWKLVTATKGTMPQGLTGLSGSILYHNNWDGNAASQLLFVYTAGNYRGVYSRQKTANVWDDWGSPFKLRHDGRTSTFGSQSTFGVFGSTSEAGVMKNVGKNIGGIYFWQMQANGTGDDNITPAYGVQGDTTWYHGIRFQHPGYTNGYWVDLAFSFNGVPYTRSNKNGTYSAWTKIFSTLENPIFLGPGSDLDNYNSIDKLGHYWTSVSDILHKPDGVISFGLKVYRTSNVYVNQDLTAVKGTTGTTEGKFTRQFNGTSWSNWVKLTTELDPANSLYTARFTGNIDTDTSSVTGECVYKLAPQATGTFPSGITSFNGCILEHINWDLVTAYQKLYSFANQNYRAIYYRRKVSGVWSSWKEIIIEKDLLYAGAQTANSFYNKVLGDTLYGKETTILLQSVPDAGATMVASVGILGNFHFVRGGATNVAVGTKLEISLHRSRYNTDYSSFYMGPGTVSAGYCTYNNQMYLAFKLPGTLNSTIFFTGLATSGINFQIVDNSLVTWTNLLAGHRGSINGGNVITELNVASTTNPGVIRPTTATNQVDYSKHDVLNTFVSGGGLYALSPKVVPVYLLSETLDRSLEYWGNFYSSTADAMRALVDACLSGTPVYKTNSSSNDPEALKLYGCTQLSTHIVSPQDGYYNIRLTESFVDSIGASPGLTVTTYIITIKRDYTLNNPIAKYQRQL